MNKKALILMVLFSLTLIVSSLYLISVLDPGEKPKSASEITNVSSNAISIPDNFQLEYSEGKNFTQANLKNKYTLLYFGFSYCPDVCPTVLQRIASAIDLLSEKELDNMQFIFVSVDPERDSPETASAFARQFDFKIQGISGEKKEIDKLTSALKGYYAKIENKESPENYYVDHSSFIYLIDPEAKLVSQFTASATAKEIADSLKARLSKK